MAYTGISMKNLPLYWTDPDVTETETVVVWAEAVDNEAGSRWRVMPESSPFYPGGGGQPGDRGTIDGFEIIGIEKGDGMPWFIVEAPDGFAPGTRVACRVDKNHRWDSRQQHTGQHLISAALSRNGVETLSVHLGVKYCGIEVDLAEFDADLADRVTADCESWIRDDVPVRSLYYGPDELTGLKLRRPNIHEDGSKRIRIVEIDGIDSVGCGGVHLSRTGEIRAVLFDGSEHLRGRKRLKWLIGDRVIRRAEEAIGREKQLTAVMSTEARALVPRVESLLRENRGLESRLRRSERELGASAVETARIREGIVVRRLSGGKERIEGGLDAGAQRGLSTLFLLGEEDADNRCPWALYVRDSEGAKEIVPKFREYIAREFGAKGGGRGPVWRGVMHPATEAQIGDIMTRLLRLSRSGVNGPDREIGR